jgi:hypothetical protein
LRSVEQTLWDTPHALLLADIELCQFTHSELGFLQGDFVLTNF